MKLLNVSKNGRILSRIEVLGLKRDIKTGKIVVELWGGLEKKMDFGQANMLLERTHYDEVRI